MTYIIKASGKVFTFENQHEAFAAFQGIITKAPAKLYIKQGDNMHRLY